MNFQNIFTTIKAKCYVNFDSETGTEIKNSQISKNLKSIKNPEESVSTVKIMSQQQQQPTSPLAHSGSSSVTAVKTGEALEPMVVTQKGVSKSKKPSSSDKSSGDKKIKKKRRDKDKQSKANKGPKLPPPIRGNAVNLVPPIPSSSPNPTAIVINPHKSSSSKRVPRQVDFFNKVKSTTCIDICKNNVKYVFWVDAQQIFHSQINQNALLLGEGNFGKVNEIEIRGSKVTDHELTEKNMSACQMVQAELNKYDKLSMSKDESLQKPMLVNDILKNGSAISNSGLESPNLVRSQENVMTPCTVQHQSSTTTIDSNLSMISSVHSTLGREPERATIMTLKLAMKRLPLSSDYNNKYHYRDRNVAEQATVAGCDFIVAYYGHVLYEAQYCILMEKCDTSLNLFNGAARKLGFTQDKGVPLAFMQKLTFNLIEALKFLKVRLNIIHRDVKPSNILLTKDMDIKLCDFGIAGDLNRSRNNPLTGGIGSQPYMSPERQKHDDRYMADQANIKREQYNDRADVWAVGLTLMETMVGEYPYGRQFKLQSNSLHLLRKIAFDDPPSFKIGWSEKISLYVSDRLSSEDELEDTPLPVRTIRRSDSEPLSDLSNSTNSDNDTIVDAFSKVSLKPDCKNNEMGDFSSPGNNKPDEQLLIEDNINIFDPAPIKSKSVPATNKEQSNGEQLIDFITQCLYKEWIEPDNVSKQEINNNDIKIRPNYEELQTTDYYKNITNAKNKPNSVRLRDYFKKVFDKLPEYIEERNNKSKMY